MTEVDGTRARRRGEDPGRTGRGPWEARHINVMAAGIWLIFLVFPLLAMLQSDVTVPVRVLWFVGLLVFAGTYLGAFARIGSIALTPLPRRHVLLATALMLVGVGLMVPGSGVAAAYLVPYFVALWSFAQDVVPGLVASAVFLATSLTVTLLLAPPGVATVWLVAPQVFSSLLIIASRFLAGQEDHVRGLREQLAAARERESVARDVHDVLGHSLTVVAVKAELARRLLTVDPGRAGAELDDVLALTRESLAEVRATVGGLRRLQLGEQLIAARTALEAAGIAARVPGADGEDLVPEARREMVAWCLREAVTNVVRHSGARRCTVTLGAGGLVVGDDGVGLGGSERAAGTEGVGLRGMHERAEAAGATLLMVEEDPGAARPGTRVEVRW